MSPFLRIPLGLIMVAAGFFMVWKTKKIIDWFGYNAWAESKMGAGSSWLFYKLLGILIVFIGVFTVTNVISDILTWFAHLFIRT